MILLLACTAPDLPDDSAVATTTLGDIRLSDLRATLSPTVATVPIVTYATSPATPSRVEFGETSEYGYRTPLDDGSGDHRAVLLGVPPGTEVHYRVVDADGAALSEDQSILTGPLPPGVPPMERTGDPDPLHSFAVSSTLGLGNIAFILDEHGRYVWYQFEDQGMLIPRARLSVDGLHVLYDAVSMNAAGDAGAMVWAPLDGSEPTRVPVPLLTHDFVELSDGTVCATAWDVREVDGESWIGDKLVEVARDGTTREVWNAWDSLDLPVGSADDIADGTWTHANALKYDPVSDNYLLGLKNFDMILAINRTTGEQQWALGGPLSEWTFAEGSEPFNGQHQFEFLDGTLLVFDNGPVTETDSRVVEYAMDDGAKTLTETWSAHLDPPALVWALGDVHRDGLGGTRVVWTTEGRIDWFDSAHGNYASLYSPFGYGISYTTWEGSLYPDTE